MPTLLFSKVGIFFEIMSFSLNPFTTGHFFGVHGFILINTYFGDVVLEFSFNNSFF